MFICVRPLAPTFFNPIDNSWQTITGSRHAYRHINRLLPEANFRGMKLILQKVVAPPLDFFLEKDQLFIR